MDDSHAPVTKTQEQLRTEWLRQNGVTAQRIDRLASSKQAERKRDVEKEKSVLNEKLDSLKQDLSELQSEAKKYSLMSEERKEINQEIIKIQRQIASTQFQISTVNPSGLLKWFGTTIAGTAIFFAAVLAYAHSPLNTGPVSSSSSQNQETSRACRDYIRASATVPNSVKHPWHSQADGRIMSSTFTAKNLLGVEIETHYTCEVDFSGQVIRFVTH